MPMRLLGSMLVLLAALAASGGRLAFAADDHAKDPHASDAESAGADVAHHEDHPKEGPITAHKQDVDLALFTLITFVVFVIVLKKFAWVPLCEGLNRREQGVLQNIADAEASRIKAEKLLASHSEKLSKVQDEVRAILAEARRDAEQMRNEIVSAAQKEADANRQRAVAEIERARDQALDELFDKMAQVVSEATEQVVGRSLSGSDHERLIQDSLSGFSSSRGKR